MTWKGGRQADFDCHFVLWRHATLQYQINNHGCWVKCWPWQTRCTLWTTQHGSRARLWVHLFLQSADSRSAHHAEESWGFTFVLFTSIIFNATDAERFFSLMEVLEYPDLHPVQFMKVLISYSCRTHMYFPKKILPHFILFLFLFLFLFFIFIYYPKLFMWGTLVAIHCENHVSIHLIITLLVACSIRRKSRRIISEIPS